MTDFSQGMKDLAELQNMRSKAGEWHYKRVLLADKLLKNKEWVEAPNGGGGDLNKALDRLEQDCFGDLCGSVGLCQLLDLLHNFPNEKDWQRNKYRFALMWAEWKSKQKPEERRVKRAETASRTEPSLPPPMEFEQRTPSEKRKCYEKSLRSLSSLEQENERLKGLLVERDAEIKRLKELLAKFKQLQMAV